MIPIRFSRSDRLALNCANCAWRWVSLRVLFDDEEEVVEVEVLLLIVVVVVECGLG